MLGTRLYFACGHLFKWSSNQYVSGDLWQCCAVLRTVYFKWKNTPLCSLWSWYVREKMLPVREKSCHHTPGSLGDWHGQQPSLEPPPPFLPHPLAVFLPLFVKEACERGGGRAHLAEAAGVELRRQLEHTNTHIHTHTCSVSVSDTSAGSIQHWVDWLTATH